MKFKKLVWLFSYLFPSYVAKIAESKINNPAVRKVRKTESSFLSTGTTTTLKFNSFDIKTYTWGSGRRKVLLVHGWEGNAGNYAVMIPAMVAAGYQVHSFDGPSHGQSSKGPTSTAEFSDLVAYLLQESNIQYIVSHSFGNVATVSALYQNPDIAIKRSVMIATPNRFQDRIDEVSKLVGISDRAKKSLVKLLESKMDLRVDQFNLSDFVKKIKVEKAIIIQDVNDRITPISKAIAISENWSAASLQEVSGTGHFRILRSPEVTSNVIQFLDS